MSLKDLFHKRNKVTYLPFAVTYGDNASFTDKHPIALACIDIIASSISALPIDLYRKNSNAGRSKDTNHQIVKLIKEPNYDETRSLFFYTLVQDYFKGNIFLYKFKNENGEVVSLFRIDPSQVHVTKNPRKIFKYDGKEYDSSTILHIPSRYGYDGLVGKSIYTYYRGAFDLANSLNSYFVNSFNNGIVGSKRVILDVSEVIDKDVTPKQIEEIRQKFLNEYIGIANSGKPIIKAKKEVKYDTIDIGSESNQEKQLSENLNIAESLICRIFNVPPSLLNGGQKDGATMERLYQSFLDFAVRPIAENLIESLSTMLTYSERQYLYMEPNYNALMRVDVVSKIDAYTKQIGNGILKPNEVRNRENLESIGTAGDYLMLPANLLPLTQDVMDARLAQQKLALIEVDKYTDKKAEGIDDSTK